MPSLIALISGASFSSALSPSRGLLAWPAAPCVVTRNWWTPFSATQTP